MKKIFYKNFKDCILFKFNMAYDRLHFKSSIQFVKNKLDEKNLCNAIIDIRSVPGDIPVMDRFELGVEIAKAMPYKYKLAVLAEKNRITKLVENVAVNRGADMLVSHDMKTIREWFRQSV